MGMKKRQRRPATSGADGAKHILLKCNWNDGCRKGADDMGWSGVCSWEVLLSNTRGRWSRANCRRSDCDCRQAADGKISYTKIHPGMRLCYESSLFQTGLFATGKHALIRQSAPGKLAVLTSCPPGEMEEFRLVIGVMPILSLNDTQKFGYPAIAGDRRRMIRLRREQMPRLWSIVHPRNVSRGLVHYLEDREVTRILGTLGKVGVSLSRVNDGLPDADVSQSSDEAIEEFVERRLRSEREFFLRNHRAADLVRKRAGGKCAVCERNVFAHYLVDVIEAHHREGGCFPGELRSIRVGDLAALCPTCHRALHRRSKDPLRPMSVEEFKEALEPF